MKIYGFSGLGADERVFKFLNLPITPINWIEPKENESIKEYSRRLSTSIIRDDEVIFIGISFGGIIAQEIAKIVKPEKIVLISSFSEQNQFSNIFKLFYPIFKLLPSKFLIPPFWIAKSLFGAKKHSQLLKNILNDTDPKFVKWALSVLANYQIKERQTLTIIIHGDNDKMIPLPKSPNHLRIKNGGHFMIVENANEITELIKPLI